LILFVRLVSVASNRDKGYAFRQLHQLDPHCVPISRPAYRLHRSPDHPAVGGDGEQLVIWAYDNRAHQASTARRDFSCQHALPSASLDRVLLDGCALGEAPVGGDQYVHTLPYDFHSKQLVTVGKTHPDDTRGRPAHRPQRLVVGVEPDGLCPLADQEQITIGRNESRPDELIILTQVDRDDATRTVGVELVQASLLDQAVLGREHQIRAYVVVCDLDDLGDPLVGLEGEQVRNVLPTGSTAG